MSAQWFGKVNEGKTGCIDLALTPFGSAMSARMFGSWR